MRPHQPLCRSDSTKLLTSLSVTAIKGHTISLRRRRRIVSTSNPPIASTRYFFSRSRKEEMTIGSHADGTERKGLSPVAPVEAVLFDIDGTLCDSDPIHYYAFREMLQEEGYNGGVPITEQFFIENISGKHNDEIGDFLFPDNHEKGVKFMEDKEAMFRKLTPQQLKPVKGLEKLCNWIKDHGLKRAAVTNAPRENAELMLSLLGLTDFFQHLIIGSECERAKPFPDPYLKGLKVLGASGNRTFVFEDSVSGIKAGVAAGMPVVGLTTRNPENLLMTAKPALVIQDFEDPKLWAELPALEGPAGANMIPKH